MKLTFISKNHFLSQGVSKATLTGQGYLIFSVHTIRNLNIDLNAKFQISIDEANNFYLTPFNNKFNGASFKVSRVSNSLRLYIRPVWLHFKKELSKKTIPFLLEETEYEGTTIYKLTEIKDNL